VTLAPSAALAAQGAELYRTTAHFYGRFEARIRYAASEGVVSSFFLWKDGSSSTTTWNELDYEKVNACKLTTNIWTGKGTQSSQTNTTTFDICADYHTYAFEWTPDYIAWFIDGTQIRRVTGANVTEYTQNASQGMAMHFNLWVGDSSFGGTLNPSSLPVRQFISWAQYSSFANGTFQMQWREDFNGTTIPSGWAAGNWSSPFNLSTHNPANVTFVNGIAVLSLTADNATGYSGTPPVDTAGGGTSGTGGAGGVGGSGAGGSGPGAAGRGGAGGAASGGSGGTGGSASAGSGGASSAGRGGNGAGGTTGSGAGGASAGTAGTGAGGAAPGAAGSGAGGVATGTAGSTGGSPASGGAPGAGGTPTGGAGNAAGSDGGCSCHTAGDGGTGGSAALAMLLIAASALRRRREAVRR
jgi:MYXO-CTERM domain-containing protein